MAQGTDHHLLGTFTSCDTRLDPLRPALVQKDGHDLSDPTRPLLHL